MPHPYLTAPYAEERTRAFRAQAAESRRHAHRSTVRPCAEPLTVATILAAAPATPASPAVEARPAA